MQAKKCDRCEKFYDPYKPDIVTKYANMLMFAEEDTDMHGGYVETRRYELCPKYMFEAVEFMQEKLSNKE